METIKELREEWELAKKEEEMLEVLLKNAEMRTHAIFLEIINRCEEKGFPDPSPGK